MKMSKENDISTLSQSGMNCKVCYKHCYNKNLVLGAEQ